MMNLAWQLNGLHDPSLKPWHLRATWQTLDDKQQPLAQGTWEEWWAARGKYKLSVTAPGFQQTEFVTDHGSFVLGDQHQPNQPIGLIDEMLLTPTPDWTPVSDVKLQVVRHKEGSAMLTCAARRLDAPMGYIESGTPLPQYCFTGDIPAIRLAAYSGGMQVVFNSIARFQDRFLAQNIRITRRGQPELDIHVDALATLAAVSDADFVPPPNAVAAPHGMVTVSEGVIAGNRIGGAAPVYPANAKAQGVQGTVVLQATIDKDGTIRDLAVVSGPPFLAQAATDAVKTWRYLPYLLNGEPVEVRTQINVVFHLGR
ncbi:MAG: energy transducer TonB [Acidobacteriaceae bacterium]